MLCRVGRGGQFGSTMLDTASTSQRFYATYVNFDCPRTSSADGAENFNNHTLGTTTLGHFILSCSHSLTEQVFTDSIFRLGTILRTRNMAKSMLLLLAQRAYCGETSK